MSANRILNKWTWFDYVNVGFLGLLALATLYPFYQVLLVSLNDPIDTLSGGIYFYFREFTLENYVYFFQNNEFVRAFLISVARTVLGASTSVFFIAAFAYGISKRWLVFRPFIMTLMVITMYFDGGLIPFFLLIRKVGLYQNFLVYIVPLLFNPFHAIIMMTFFRGIPEEIEESVRMDGADYITIFIRIVIPISTPVIAAIALFNAVHQWNAWFDTLLFGNRQLMTLQMLLVEIIRDVDLTRKLMQSDTLAGQLAQFGFQPTVESVKATAMAVTALPIIMVYPFLQKYFVKGIMIGSLKG